MAREMFPDVVHDRRIFILPPDATMRNSAQKVALRDVRAVRVRERGRLIEVLSRCDFLRYKLDRQKRIWKAT
jgi:hypothetical protein